MLYTLWIIGTILWYELWMVKFISKKYFYVFSLMYMGSNLKVTSYFRSLKSQASDFSNFGLMIEDINFLSSFFLILFVLWMLIGTVIK